MRELIYLAIAFYIASFLISLTCAVYCLIQNRFDKTQKKLYMIMLVILLLNSVSEAIARILRTGYYRGSAVPIILLLCHYFYFVLHTLLLPMLCMYVLSITGKAYRINKFQHFLFLVPVSFVELLMLTNPFHSWGYSFNLTNSEYHRGWGVTALYIVSVFYIGFFVFNIFSSWKGMNAKRKIAMSYFLVMVISGIVIQMLFIDIRVELFAESLAFLGLLILVENEDDLIDSDSGIYNRKALRIEFDNLVMGRGAFHIICLKIENADTVRRITGSSNTALLTSIIVKELYRHFPRYNTYQTSPDTFVMIMQNTDENKAIELAEVVRARFDRSFILGNTELMLEAVIMLAQVPRDINSTEDLFDMTDSSLPVNHKQLIAGKEDLEYLLRRRAVESAVQRAINNGGFEVFYQPIYSTDNLRICGAEALLRLNDDRLGWIMPDEFIPIAEHIGLIGELDDSVLRTVCAFISSGVPAKKGIRSINVNLSVLQCIRPGFADHIKSIVDQYNIDKRQISFEITESASAQEYTIMGLVVRRLKKYGFTVYMDDFGSGYSNVNTLFTLDFDMIKVDKAIIWGAQESELGMIILENNIRMLHQMGLPIVAEGVETDEQTAILKKLGVEYLQGFRYSRPMPKGDLLLLLSDR